MEDLMTNVSPTLVMPFNDDILSSIILGDWGAHDPLPIREYFLFWTVIISISSMTADMVGWRLLLYVGAASTMLLNLKASPTTYEG